MASVAQIQANRSNAQKSTGPRTAQGKAIASQNAVKHGLLAEQVVIHGEDPAQFDLYREEMLADLAPVGGIETMLAERAASLAWRLRRAERLQNIAFAALDEGEPTELLEARLKEWKQHKGSERDRTVCGVLDENTALAQRVVEDFAGSRVMDRMLMYERRIENSLYRTMRELRREREARTAAEASHSQADPEVNKVNQVNTVNTVLTPRSKDALAVDQEPAIPTELASFGADCTDSSPRGSDKRSLRSLSMAPSQEQDHRQTSLSLPLGVEEGPSSTLHASLFTLHEPSCETNPIPGGPDERYV